MDNRAAIEEAMTQGVWAGQVYESRDRRDKGRRVTVLSFEFKEGGSGRHLVAVCQSRSRAVRIRVARLLSGHSTGYKQVTEGSE